MTSDAAAALSGATVDGSVWELRTDYRALLVVADGREGGPRDERSDAALAAAEAQAVRLLGGRPPEALPQVAEWRAAYLSFGVKHRAGRSSVEALLRRCAAGLPRIDRLTDLYNAVSVQHLIPLGGEDLAGYYGPPRLTRADGTETFDTVADGEAVVLHPDPGEVVWRDDAGVTCRRWNWRQCSRTRLTPQTTRAVFILDGLGDDASGLVSRAGEALVSLLGEVSPGATFAARLVAPTAADG